MPRALAILLLIVLVLPIGAAARASELDDARAKLYEQYAAKLAELAAECRQQDLPDAAKQLDGWLPKRAPDELTLFVLPHFAPAEAQLPADTPQWRQKWQALRQRQSDALVALAEKAARAGHASLGYELLTESLRENPDQPTARRVLGYVKAHGKWLTPFELRQQNSGKVWHDEFGWLPKTQVERYDRGQRYFQGRWITAKDETDLRGDIKRGWRIESEHYVVTTNHSLAEGVKLSQRLETLYALWRQVFAGFQTGEAELVRRFDNKPVRRDSRQHNVVYLSSRQEYNDALRAAQPQIEITLGIYFDTTRTAYFFAGEDQDAGTLYHEATHQLFQEARPTPPEVARTDNFWIVEGIACYMESLKEHEGYYTLGGANAGRMPAARYRLFEDKFYVPLAELVRMGMQTIQHDPRIAQLYSQSAGLADFLMHDGGGRYREALVRYLEAIYSGRATATTLAELTTVTYEKLDSQYADFLRQGEPAKTTARRADF